MSLLDPESQQILEGFITMSTLYKEGLLSEDKVTYIRHTKYESKQSRRGWQAPCLRARELRPSYSSRAMIQPHKLSNGP